MAESKNNFFKAKMNKDLDSRLLESSEYRDALNISVGKSEDHSVGSLQNILGNIKLTIPGPSGTVPLETNTNLVCVGYFVDNENSRIFQFLTDYTDPSPSLINLPPADREMKITVYNASNNSAPYVTLVSGIFLNLSTTELITGINLIENLLFWTDNRNQPRKINVSSALANPATSANPYYTNVTQISVAKYAPFKAPTLYEEVNIEMEDIASVTYLGQTKIVVPSANTLQLGDQLVNEDLGTPITAGDFAVIIKKGTAALGIQEIYIAGHHAIPAGEKLTFYRTTITSSDDNTNVNGNDNFLIDKFVRFSYRFKFDDNEYSLMAPFTQPIFIPLQKGYFTSGDEDAAYASTVLDWMQNRANGVALQIELPDIGADVATSYKIKSLDILYKESDSLAIKVVESIPVLDIQQDAPTTNIYTYTYSSQKPKKTLQEAETIRVYDKVPIRALAQESAGNRIIYGNFVNQSTPPANLDYSIQVIEKNTPRTAWYEYPNHTLKQNRTYQVGVVLADKFGRQSSVILSNAVPFAAIEDVIFGTSSVFFPYKNDRWDIPVKNWLGDVLSITFNSTINSVRDENLYTPGLYATVSGSITSSSDGFEVIAPTTIIGNVYNFTLVAASLGTTPQRNYPAIGNFLKGKYTDYVEVINVNIISVDNIEVTTDNPISDLYEYNAINDPDIKYSYSINELGWYSYKVVVKQTEQEYYNVYVPGMLAGYPIYQTSNIDGTNVEDTIFPPNEENSTCHFVLINDNINKVPRDLSEVGPNQKQYRSSVQLWGRVENVLLNPMSTDPLALPLTTNRQYYPGTTSDTVSTIASTTDLNFLFNSIIDNPKGSAEFNIYQFNTNPLIARVSTVNQIGVIGNYDTTPTAPDADKSMSPFLGVYETSAVESLLDIFWETSTSDYISNLNWDINVGSNGVTGFSTITFLYNEYQPLNEDGWLLDTGTADSSWVTAPFWFTSLSGAFVPLIDSVLFQAFDRNGTDVSTHFDIVEGPSPGDGYFRIKITDNTFYFGQGVDIIGSFIFRFLVTNTVFTDTYIVDLNTDAYIFKIENATPQITRPFEDDITYFIPINQPGGTGVSGSTRIIDSVGENGNSNSGANGAELYWTLESVTPINDQSFIIPPDERAIGDIRLANNTPTEGISNWNINLKDSTNASGFTTPIADPLFPSLGSLETNRTLSFDVESRSIWCGQWNTNWQAFVGGYRLYSAGYIDIWRMMKPGETIEGLTLRVSAFKQFGDAAYTLCSTPAFFLRDPLAPVGQITWTTPSLHVLSTGFPVWVEYLQFTGTITLEGPDGIRILNQTFESQGHEPVSPVLYGSISQQCTSYPGDDFIDPPYTSNDLVDWEVDNISTVPVYWRGIKADLTAVVGGTLDAGNTIANDAYFPPGTETYQVRDDSIRATGQGGVLSTINYI